MDFKSKIEGIKKLTSLRDYRMFYINGSKGKIQYDEDSLYFESNLEDKYDILKYDHNIEELDDIGDIDLIIEYDDLFSLEWYEKTNVELWDFITNHHKQTGEIIYAFAQNLIPIYNNFKIKIDDYQKGKEPQSQSIFDYKLPINDYFLKSMHFRLLLLKNFIDSLERFSYHLAGKLNLELNEEEQNSIDELNTVREKAKNPDKRISPKAPKNIERIKALKEFSPALWEKLVQVTDNKKDITGKIIYLITGANPVDAYQISFTNKDKDLDEIDSTEIDKYKKLLYR